MSSRPKTKTNPVGGTKRVLLVPGARVSDALGGFACSPVTGWAWGGAFCIPDCPFWARLGQNNLWTNASRARCLAARFDITGSEGGSRKWPAGQLSSWCQDRIGPELGARRVASCISTSSPQTVAGKIVRCTWLGRTGSHAAALGAMSHRIRSDHCLSFDGDDAMHEEIAVKRCLDVNGQLRAVAGPHPPKCSPPASDSHASGAQKKMLTAQSGRRGGWAAWLQTA